MMNGGDFSASSEQVEEWLKAAFPGRPGFVVEDRQAVGSFQQSLERITVRWSPIGETEEVYLRLYRGYLSWWTLITPDLPLREQAAWRIASGAGIPLPEVLYTSQAPDVAILRRERGEPWKIPSDLDAVHDAAAVMARLHAAPIREENRTHLPNISLAALLPRFRTWAEEAGDPASCRGVDEIAKRFGSVGERPPGFLHGDWHPGNFLRDESRMTAVLDWEEAAFGDPRIDVAQMYASLRGKYPGLVEPFLGFYEELAGFPLGPLQIWLDLNNLRNRIVSVWVKHSLAQHHSLPSANPQVWIE